MPIDATHFLPPPMQPLIPKGPGYRYEPVDYDEEEWELTYCYTYEDEHHLRIVFRDTRGGTHVRMIFKDKNIKDF